MAHFGIGKLPAELLARLLARYTHPDPRVLVGPAVGEDAAIIDMGDRCLVAKTDPITFAIDEIGWYAVHVNANDVVCCGATPRWYLATLLLPEQGTGEALVENIFAQMAAACSELGISLCGGHTEITHGLVRPIVVGQMLGEVDHGEYVTSGGARVGDALILTKGIAIEGTAIIVREKREAVEGILAADELARCAGFLRDPGISVVDDARIALETGAVHALHDPTEGGIATGLWELAEAAGVGVRVDRARIPILPECEAICRHLGLDPLGLIASGSLLISAAPERATDIVERLAQAGIAAAVIGDVVSREHGHRMRDGDRGTQPLPTFTRDEIARLFG